MIAGSKLRPFHDVLSGAVELGTHHISRLGDCLTGLVGGGHWLVLLAHSVAMPPCLPGGCDTPPLPLEDVPVWAGSQKMGKGRDMIEQYIHVGGGPAVGNIVVNESRITGEGGPSRPRLVIPAVIKMSQRPDDSALALTELRASLRPHLNAQPGEVFGTDSIVDLATGFVGWTVPDRTNDSQVQLRFALTAVDVEEIELRRHRVEGGKVQFALFIDPLIEGVLHFNQQRFGATNPNSGPWDNTGFGMYSQRLPFWSAKVQTMLVTIEMSQWVESILPSLGYNKLRLMEVIMPPPLPGHGAAATEFDKARLAFDQRRYSECAVACRSLVDMWKQVGQATKENPLDASVADKLGWSSTDPRRRFLSDTWKATVDLVNAAHHVAGQPDPQEFGAPETRLLFRQVALLSEFLSEVL
jgi:hypothetical protein